MNLDNSRTLSPAEAGGAPAQPIFNTDLPNHMRHRFDELIDEIYDLTHFHGDAEEFGAVCGRLSNKFEVDVTAFPVLARTVSKVLLKWSLLAALCEKIGAPMMHPAMKFLIEKNPHALLWNGYNSSPVIHTIAANHCALMPWIAERFLWVFDHHICQEEPPHLELVRQHADGRCDASTVRHFYEFYPIGLTQENEIMQDGLPLHRCLLGWEDCDFDLFKWMAQQHPDAMLHQDRWGKTPLHNACCACGSRTATNNDYKICGFLVEECPASVRVIDSHGRLTIHYLTKRTNRPAVQKIVMELLTKYPSSLDASVPGRNASRFYPTPQTLPFISEVYPLLEDQRLLKEDVPFLKDLTAAFVEGTRCSGDELLLSVSQVFKTWTAWRATEFTAGRLAQLSDRIEDICSEYEEEDVDSDDGSLDGDEEEDFDSDDGSLEGDEEDMDNDDESLEGDEEGFDFEMEDSDDEQE